MNNVKHPATYTNSFIPKFAEILIGCENVLDIFGGIGKLALIKQYGFTGKVVCNELEKEWVEASNYDVDEWHIGDAANMEWAKDNYFDAICTSPTYGNRMADHHNAKDNSRRITYKHYLGRDLNIENTGRMQWGDKYREKHLSIYKECKRVLKKNGIIIINVSNHIRKGQVIDVVKWHKEALVEIGFFLDDEILVDTPRMRYGKNNDLRVSRESILILRK